MQFLLVENDQRFAILAGHILTRTMQEQGMTISILHARTIKEAIMILATTKDIVLILFDLGLSDMTDIIVLQTIIEAAPDVPILILTDRSPDREHTTMLLGTIGFATKNALLNDSSNFLTLVQACMQTRGT